MFELTQAERSIEALSRKDTIALLAKYGDSVDGHALFAPSAASMWLKCAGSLLLRAKYGDSAGIDAALGTVAHWVAETWNREGARPDYLVGTERYAMAGGKKYTFTIDELMLDYVGMFVDWCAELEGDHYFEQKVDLSDFLPIPNQRGTADHFCCQLSWDADLLQYVGVLIITDLKYGTGVRVYAEGNYQALCYALAVFHEWDFIYNFQRIVIRICHPRLDVFDVWEISRDDLLKFAEFLRVRALHAYRENAPRTPSAKACQWCEGRATCPARLRELESVIDDTMDDLEEDDREEATYGAEELQEAPIVAFATMIPRKAAKPVTALSSGALSYTYTLRKHVEKWFKSIGEELLKRAEAGETLPHQKLVDGRMQTKWKDEENAFLSLSFAFDVEEDDLRPRVFVSPNKAVKAIRKRTNERLARINAVIEGLVVRHAGKRTLAPIKDEREDSFASAENMAEDAEDDDEL